MVLRLLKFIFTILIFFIPLTGLGLNSDKNYPCYITSKSVSYFKRSNTIIYQDNVQVKQGSSHLTSDTMELYLDKTGRHIEWMKLTGKPADYSTLQDEKKGKLYASADIIKYYPKKAQAVLLNHAYVKEEGNSISGPHILYDLKSKTAYSTPTQIQGTSVIIQGNH